MHVHICSPTERETMHKATASKHDDAMFAFVRNNVRNLEPRPFMVRRSLEFVEGNKNRKLKHAEADGDGKFSETEGPETDGFRIKI